MLPDSLFDDFSDILETGGELFLFIMAKGDVVGDFAIVANSIHGVFELESGFLELAFFYKIQVCLTTI